MSDKNNTKWNKYAAMVIGQLLEHGHSVEGIEEIKRHGINFESTELLKISTTNTFAVKLPILWAFYISEQMHSTTHFMVNEHLEKIDHTIEVAWGLMLQAIERNKKEENRKI